MMKKTLLAVALLGASTGAMADSWIYGGVQGGQSSIDSENGSAFGVHAGTGILPFIGIEAGYMNHGSADIEIGNIKGDVEASSFYVAAKPSIDFGPLHVYAKGGLNTFDLSYGGALSSASSDDGVSVMYGVGAEYFIFDMLSVGGSYQSFGVEVDGDRDQITSFTVNATFHFL